MIEEIFLFKNSDKLFNIFIYQVLSTINELNIFTKKTKKLLNESSSNNIIINDKIVLETKFKYIKNLKNSSKADIYHISKYCILQNKKEAILIYPEYDKKLRLKYNLKSADSDKACNLKIATINLKRDLKTELEDVKNELIEILGVNNG